MATTRRCVQCEVTHSEVPDRTFFRFPRDKIRCKLWTSLLCNVFKTPKKTVMVCASHFHEWCFTSSEHKHLTRDALPNMDTHLNAIREIQREQSRCQEASHEAHLSTNGSAQLAVKELPGSVTLVITPDVPNWSSEDETAEHSYHKMREACEAPLEKQDLPENQKGERPTPASSNMPCDNHPEELSDSSNATLWINPDVPNCSSDGEIAEHSYHKRKQACEPPLKSQAVRVQPGESSTLSSSNMLCDNGAPVTSSPMQLPRPVKLTPACKKIKRLTAKVAALRKQLALTRKPHHNVRVLLQELSNLMPHSTYTFVASQIRAAVFKAKERSSCGMRWTSSEKEFALNLYLQSPRAYRFLRRHLSLPSKGTLLKTGKDGRDSRNMSCHIKRCERKGSSAVGVGSKVHNMSLDERSVS